MRTLNWNRVKDEIPGLVDAFFANDPYYPRPYPTDPLYRQFSAGYMSACSPNDRNAVELGSAFLHAIEMEHLGRNPSSHSVD
jgi:hypothetical protein